MSLLRLSSSSSLLQIRRLISTSSVNLSGHNKWSKIKEKKGANDAQKGALYSRATRDIALAVRMGGSADPEQNATLAAVIKRVKSQGFPKDNIENALKKAAGGKGKGDQQLVYEALGPGSVGVIIECMSDNVNRTMHSLRNILSDYNARLAPVRFLFSRRGIVKVAVDKGIGYEENVDLLIQAMIDAGAENFEDTWSDTDVELEFACQPQDLAKLTATAVNTGLCRELLGSDLLYFPTEKSDPLDEEIAKKVSELVNTLEEHEDVLRVWTT